VNEDSKRTLVDPLIRGAWREAEATLAGLLDDLGATEDAYSPAVWLRWVPIEAGSPAGDWLRKKIGDEKQLWAYIETEPRTGDGQRHGLALPVARERADAPYVFPFVEIHTRLIAWWLCYAWRARQLSSALALLSDRHQTIAAAACSRALVETAAALWVDGRKLESLWALTKEAGPPESDKDVLVRRKRLVAWLDEVQFGAKFNDRASDAQAIFGRVSRTNALGQVEKLAKATDGDLETDYQWLCNTVHPSIGTTFAFSAPPLVHDTRTHSLLSFSGGPIEIRSANGAVEAERTVKTAVARASTTALRVLTTVLDDALRIVDDVGLTSEAAALADFHYWRALRPAERNEECPCRSGKKAKRCHHGWKMPAPRITESFTG
jgi:hypothetical protein